MLFYFFRKSDSLLAVGGTLCCIADAFLGPVSNILLGRIFTALAAFSSGSRTSQEFMREVLKMCTGLWSLALIQVFTAWSSYSFWTLLGYRQGHRARAQLYSATTMRGLDWFDANEKAVGTTTMVFKDIQDLEHAVGSVMRDLISAAVSLFLQLIVAFYYSWSVTLVSMVGLPIMIVCTILISKRVNVHIGNSKALLDTISSRCDWVLRCLTTVICFQKQSYEKVRMEDLIKEEMKLNMNQHHLSALLQGISRFLILAIFVEGFFFGSYMVRYHGLNSGNVITVFWSCLAVAGGLGTILNLLLGLQRGIVASQRIVLHVKRDNIEVFKKTIGQMPQSLRPGDGEVKFEDVVFSYPSRPEIVLTGLTVTFEAGEVSYVLGPSGSGKSSLASLLCRQYQYQAGQISINGIPIPHLSQKWIEQNVYVVEQQTKLFDIPLVDNIRIGAVDPAKVTFAEIEKVCDIFKIDFVSELPNGLLTRGSYPLSGGQKQRIGLARAFVRDAPIMIFDESTSALDPGMRSTVMKAILGFRRNKTTIIITHQTDLIPPNKPVYFVQDGQICYYSSLTQYRRQSVVPIITRRPNSHKPVCVEPVLSSKSRSTWFMFSTVRHKKLLLLGFILVSAQAAVNPVFGFIFSKLLMGILPGSGVNVTLWAMLVLLLAFCDGILTYSHVVLDYVSEDWQKFIRESLFERLLSRRYLESRKVSYYNKLLFSDTERASLILASYWPSLVNLAVLGVMAFIWCLVEGWELTLIGISISPLFFMATQCYRLVSYTWTKNREVRRNNVMKLMIDIVEGFHTVKTQNLEAFFEVLYQQREIQLHSIAMPMTLWTGLMYGLVKLFPYTAQGLLLWYGMRLIAEGRYTTNQTMVVFTILIFALMTMSGIAGSIAAVNNGFEASERIQQAAVDDEDLETTPKFQIWEYDDFVTLNFRNISFNDVGITYANGSSVLGGFTVDIKAKEAVAIVGPSGVGKSTIARMLLKLQTPSQGIITIDNAMDLEDIPTEIVRKRIAVVGQMPLDFLDDTIMENLLYATPEGVPREIAEQRAMNACRDCGLEKFILDLDEGYNTRIKNGLLSGGQMQRLGIARCLLREPEVLILDECTSALDVESCAQIKSLLIDMKNQRKVTLMIVTHQMEVAAIADRVISLF